MSEASCSSGETHPQPRQQRPKAQGTLQDSSLAGGPSAGSNHASSHSSTQNTPTLHLYPTKVYADPSRKRLLARLGTTSHIPYCNIYSLIDTVCVFSQKYQLMNAQGELVKRDDDQLEPGEYFISTSGKLTYTGS